MVPEQRTSLVHRDVQPENTILTPEQETDREAMLARGRSALVDLLLNDLRDYPPAR